MSALPRTREGQIERYARHCKHFNGLQNKQCEAGIDYNSIPKYDGAFPCFGEFQCAKYEAQGADAVRARFEEADKQFKGLMVARQAIVDHTNGERGVAGKIPCPVCTVGELRFTIAKCNGHIHAKCLTAGCVAWVE